MAKTKEKKIFVLDTSVILYEHNSIMNFDEHDVAIPITVLEEIDHFKKGNDIKNFEADQMGKAGKWSGWFIVITALAGLGICLYLYSLHVALLMGEIKGGLLCGTDKGLGCHSVASSPFSSIMGLPLASWGAIFYGALVLLVAA